MAEVVFRNVQELHQLPADIIVAGVVCGRVVRTATGEYRADTVLYTVCGEKRVSGYGVDRMAAYLDSRRRMREEALYVLRALDDTESPAYGAAAVESQDVYSHKSAALQAPNESDRDASYWAAEYAALVVSLNLGAKNDIGGGEVCVTVTAPAGMVFANTGFDTLSMSGPSECRRDVYRSLVLCLREGLRLDAEPAAV